MNVIGRHFSGPLKAGHGAYTGCLAAREIGAPAAVTPRTAPALEDHFALEPCGDGLPVLRTAVNAVHGMAAATIRRTPAGRCMKVVEHGTGSYTGTSERDLSEPLA